MSAKRPGRAAGAARSAALLAATLASLFSSAVTTAQPAPPNGPREINPRWHALTGATVITQPGESLENATIVVRDGVIVSVEKDGKPPAGTRAWDLKGMTVYPGLIDAHVPVDAPKPDAKAPGAHWNSRVTPQRRATDGAGVDEKTRKALRDLGFTAAAIAPKGGIFAGQGAVVSLADAPRESEAGAQPLVARAFHAMNFDIRSGRGGGGGEGEEAYPGSLMGAIALIRQTLGDAEWRAADLAAYRANPAGRERPMPADALDALARLPDADAPLLFACEDELDALRAAKIAKEFGRKAMLVGSGTEFRRLEAIARDGLPIVLPLNFPETPKVETIGEAEGVDLRDLMTWEQAPTNPRRLDAAGMTVALTTDKLKSKADFRKRLREAIAHGLAEEKALAMLTTTPAKMLGVEGRLGRIAPGYAANLVVVEGSYFKAEGKVRDVWIDGERTEVSAAPMAKLEGVWAADFPDLGFAAEFIVRKGNAVTIKAAEKEGKARGVKVADNRVSMLIDNDPWGDKGAWSLSAVIEGDEMLGTGVSHQGVRFAWSAKRTAAEAPKPEPKKKDAAEGDKKPDASGARDKGEEKAAGDDKDAKEGKEDADLLAAAKDVPEALPLPFGGYGLDAMPPQDEVVITNATVWTNAAGGVMKDASVWIKGGKIAGVGAGLAVPAGARTIDARGKHVTAGIIDCHSHTGISRGVNEGTQAITAEVRIFDVINPDDASWYRQLASGVTAVNQLHGSANPIGGQNSVAKNRWGVAHPDEMRFQGAPAGIKFALGENVKQSNWGDRSTTRYPQTRMGVETLIRDAFDSAREYTAAFEAYGKLTAADKAKAAPPRKDLEREALAEILAGKRLVHCHSYRQDEILMLTRIAKDYGFRIGTFQHVLEGYKVADAIKETAIGGSCFADWWAYKVEVQDAIPEDGAIMHEVGVVVSFNSDSDELARRLNAEAGKAMKYGSVPPTEAWKFVTLNPAKQLMVDKFVGSVEVGKDADLAVWSGEPMSSMTRCEATFVDGRMLFSLEQDRALRAKNMSERERLIQKALAKAKNSKGEGDKPDGAPSDRPGRTGRPSGPTPGLTSGAQAEADLVRETWMRMLRDGEDPTAHRCGECGDSVNAGVHQH